MIAPPETAGPRHRVHGVLFVLGVALASVLIRIPLLNVPMINDEGGYAYVAHFMSPTYQLYRDIPFYRPQAIFYVYRLIFATLGGDVSSIRLFAALWNAASVGGVFLLGLATSSRGPAAAGAILFAVFSASPSIEGFTANAEIFAQLPIVLSVLLVWKKRWFAAGVLAGVAVLLKPSGISAFLLGVIWALIAGRSFLDAVRVTAGFALALVPSLLHGAWTGWEYYWDSMFNHRVAYATPEALGLRTQMLRVARGILLTAPSWSIPAVLSAVAISDRRGRAEKFALIWLGTSVIGMAIGGFWFQHYFIQVLPPLALLGGMGISVIVAGRRRWGWLLPLAVAIAIFSRDALIWAQEPADVSWSVYRKPGYLGAEAAARYVAENTEPSASIFVAFSQAEIYYLAQRKASFPHMYYADFTYSADLFQGAIESIRLGEPSMVVVAQAPPPHRMSREEFGAVLSARYDRVHVVEPTSMNAHPIHIFRRRAP